MRSVRNLLATWIIITYSLATEVRAEQDDTAVTGVSAEAGTPPPGAPLAASFRATFTASALAPYVPVGNPALIVVGAGEKDASLGQATTALVESLRASGRAKLVMNAAALGRVAQLDDAAIVRRCASLPVDHVVVVRVFAGAPGSPPQAVVSFYRKGETEALTAFTAAAGEPVPAPSSAENPSSGLPAETARAVLQVAEHREGDIERARSAYELRHIGIIESSNGPTLYQGRHREPLRGSSLYAAVGRRDLAARYEQRNNLRWTGMIGGVAMIIGGSIVINKVEETCPDETKDETCTPGERILAGTGALLVLSGIGASVWGYFATPHPVSKSQRRRLAHEHNVKLRKELGLPSDHASAALRHELRAQPWFRANGGGLTVTGSF